MLIPRTTRTKFNQSPQRTNKHGSAGAFTCQLQLAPTAPRRTLI